MQHPFVTFVDDRGLLPECALKVLAEQRDWRHEPIGTIAAGHGLLTLDQIDRILDLQRGSRKRFGEIAVELGYLSLEQVEVLAGVQQLRSAAQIAEALALGGLMSLEDAGRLLGSFLLRDTEAVVLAENAHVG